MQAFMAPLTHRSIRLKSLAKTSDGRLVLYVALMLVGTSSATPTLPESNSLYAPCVSCHQVNAWGSADGVIPSLAAQQPRYLEKRLRSFRFDAREVVAPPVPAHSKWDSERNSAALVKYLSDLQPNPSPLMGPAEHLRVGQEIYAHICAACHGADGLGESRLPIPRIAGQNYPYLRLQIEEAAELHGDRAPPEMTGALRGMRSADKAALADYISRLGVSGALLDSSPLARSLGSSSLP
jgi:cytochrome c553